MAGSSKFCGQFPTLFQPIGDERFECILTVPFRQYSARTQAAAFLL
jgi:hypothetical protein